jgi:hypothetical protein
LSGDQSLAAAGQELVENACVGVYRGKEGKSQNVLDYPQQRVEERKCFACIILIYFLKNKKLRKRQSSP